MLIGFTYDLKDDYLKEGYSKDEVAEFDSLVTINAISGAIEAEGHNVERIGNFSSLTQAVSSGKRWDLVFNICEGLYGAGRESLVPAFLDAFRIPYTFSDPFVHALTLNKAFAKRVLRDASLPTAYFVLAEGADYRALNAPFPHFVKAVGEGTGKGITPASKVFNGEEEAVRVSELIREFNQPVIIEPFLPGREVTVGVLCTGEDAFCAGVLEVGFTDKADSDIHSYHNKQYCEEAAIYTLIKDEYASKCGELALSAHRLLGIRDASRIDIRADAAGRPQIMEINSLPGLMPVRSDLIILAEKSGISYQEVITTILNSALQRC